MLIKQETSEYEVYGIKVSFMKMKNYSYIVVDKKTRDGLVIDPTWELEKIENIINEYDVNLKKILLTHSHFDHVQLVKTIRQKYKTDIFMHEKEPAISGINSKNVKTFKHNDIIFIGETGVKCLHTPGHTEGGTCFLLSESVFTGDTVFIEGSGLCDNDKEAGDLYDSFQMLRKVIKSQALVYPGHSYGKTPGIPFEWLLTYNVYFHFDSKEKFIDFRFRKNKGNLFDFK
jgi:hydroxyacylglutathione hydrolase